MDHQNLIAIDTHTHLEVSCRNPFDNYGEEYDRAADKYFRSSRRPTMDETLAYYREKKIGFVNFTVDAESQMGRKRITNEEIADAALAKTLLKDRVLFGSDYPLITPDRWMKDFEEASFKDEVKPGILKGNAVRLLGLDGADHGK